MAAPVAAGTLPKKEHIPVAYPYDLQPGLPTIEVGSAELPTADDD